jgi:hypothetical protein
VELCKIGPRCYDEEDGNGASLDDDGNPLDESADQVSILLLCRAGLSDGIFSNKKS